MNYDADGNWKPSSFTKLPYFSHIKSLQHDLVQVQNPLMEQINRVQQDL